MTENHFFYSKFINLYEFIFKPFFFPAIKKTMADVDKESPEKLLEVGVGTGYSLAHYPNQTSVVGVDISDKMVEISKKRASKIPEKKIEILKSSGEDLPFEDESFDMVVSFSVITVVTSPQDFLNQLRRVLKTGNKALLIMHARSKGFNGFIDRIFDLPCKIFLGFTLLRNIHDLDLSGWELLDHRPASYILWYPYNHKVVLKKT